jgi:hypothetical protein
VREVRLPRRRELAIAGGFVFGLLPVLLFAALRPLHGTHEVKYFDQHVIVPVDSGFTADVGRGGGGELVTWKPPSSGAAQVFYRVYRARPVVSAPDPTLPPTDPRRSPNGIKFLDAALTVRGVFKNPTTAGDKVWRSIFTPYAPGTGNPNAPGTREAQGLVPMPYALSLKRIKRVRRGFYRVAGTLNIAGRAPTAVTVALFSATVKKGRLNFKVVARTRTRRGKFGFTRRLPRKSIVVFAEREPTLQSCTTTISPAPCTAAIESNAISRVLRVAPPAKKKRR